MAVLAGFLAGAPDWITSENPYLSTLLYDLTDPLLFGGRIYGGTAAMPVGLHNNQFHQSAHGRAILGFKAHNYQDDFYNRIHITPQRMALGDILSVQTGTVTLWNAWFEPRTLISIDGAVGGMTTDGPSPPHVFQPMSETEYNISVTQEGDAVVDTILSWSFDNGDMPGLRITADRVFIFSFLPDWSDGIVEKLEWKTEILVSQSLVEQRRALRESPRRSFAARLYVDGRERQFMDLALFNWSARIWGLPIWPEVQLLSAGLAVGGYRINCQTAYLDFRVGGLAILRSESAFDYEGVVVSSIDANGLDLAGPLQNAWPAGTRLYPARIAQLLGEPDITRLTDQSVAVDVEFLVMENNDWPAVAPPAMHQGYPVLEMVPDETEDLSASQARLLATFDSGTALPQTIDVAGIALRVRSWNWLGHGRQEHAEFRSILYALRGQQVPVWVPSHAEDVTIVSSFGASTIDIAYCGYTRFAQVKPGRRDIRIELYDGTVYHRRITGCTELSPAIERLLIDTAIGVTISPAQVRRVSWMALSRLSSDTAEIEHVTDSEGVSTCSLTFREVRDDAV